MPNVISIHAPRTGSDIYRLNAKTTGFYFNPRSPHGERRGNLRHVLELIEFQSTLPARGATCGLLEVLGIQPISIHAPRTGSDKQAENTCRELINFNPRSPHGERHKTHNSALTGLHISIHAPRTGSDLRVIGIFARAGHFNPRSPHGERLFTLSIFRSILAFQSTLPARGATFVCWGVIHMFTISIHAPRTGSDQKLLRILGIETISIHAPRTGSDLRNNLAYTSKIHFNPRSPHGERHVRCEPKRLCPHFNPRSPHGERL